VKIPLYARAGIAEAWLLDLTTAHVEVFREPSGDGYREIIRLERGASLTPLTFPDLTLAVDDLLG
jgi:Uma2 family endonuclease